MTILADSQIRALCEVPVGEFVVSDHSTFGVAKEVRVPFYGDDIHRLDELADMLMARHKSYPHETPVAEHYSKEQVTRKRENFKPMIEPFFSKQVRATTRYATNEELRAFNLHHPDNKDHPEYNPDYKLPEGAEYNLDHGLIFPNGKKVISYGLSSFGYDVTCGDEFKIFTNVNSAVVDPKNFDPNSFVTVKTTAKKPYIIIPPNSFALAVTREYFCIPRDVLTVCLGKSTYARCGIIVNVTPFEPEWEGYVTLEFSNTTPLPAKIYADEGCAQVLFFRGSVPCDVSYKDRSGKYMGQVGEPVVPKV